MPQRNSDRFIIALKNRWRRLADKGTDESISREMPTLLDIHYHEK
ncbi:hypothetical protein [Sporosarcina sp. NPDC096371]